MEQEQIEAFGQRALACGEDFRWFRGMANTAGRIAMEVREENGRQRVRWAYKSAQHYDVFGFQYATDGDVPDFSDPLTAGALLHLVCLKWEIAPISINAAVIAEATDYSESYDMGGGRLEIRKKTLPLFCASGGCRTERLLQALEASTEIPDDFY